MADWNEHSTLSNFRNLRAGQFDPLREALGINLSDEQLTQCAVHCALALRRDPTVGELYLWDRLAIVSSPAAKATLTALETESHAIAETYADMMAKRRELLPVSAPLSLVEALSLASDAMERGGKERGFARVLLNLKSMISAPCATNGITEEKAPAFLALSAKKSAFSAPEPGDICMLIERGELSHYAFLEKVLPFWESEDLQAKLRGAFSVSGQGLLPLLLSVFDGFTIDLSCFGQPAPSPEILVGNFAGDFVWVLPKAAVKEVAENLRDLGVKSLIFAELTNGSQLTLLGRQRLVQNTDFLRSLLRARADCSVKLQTAQAAQISHLPHFGYSCRFLPLTAARAESLAVAGFFASAASAPLSAGAFPTAVLTALAPVISCALAGVSYSDLRLAVDLALPQTSAPDLSPAFAAAIGLYRVQAELGIPAAQTAVSEKAVKAPVLSAFAIGKGKKAPAGKLAGADSKIYLIRIPLSPEGLPDFAALRLLLDDLAAQAQNDVIRSARLVLQKAPKKVLAEMQSETLCACPEKSAKSIEKPLALGILLESVYEMPFDCVATVRELPQSEPAVSEPEPADPFRLPKDNGLIWRSAPEIVIWAKKESPDALALAKYLRGSGNTVQIFEPAEKDLFLRAVLTASAVYCLPAARLPKGKKADFAYSVMRQNGGKIRSLRKI